MIEPDMKHISQDRPEDPCVDDDVVLYVVIGHGDASIPHLSLCHGHPVVMHLFAFCDFR